MVARGRPDKMHGAQHVDQFGCRDAPLSDRCCAGDNSPSAWRSPSSRRSDRAAILQPDDPPNAIRLASARLRQRPVRFPASRHEMTRRSWPRKSWSHLCFPTDRASPRRDAERNYRVRHPRGSCGNPEHARRVALARAPIARPDETPRPGFSRRLPATVDGR